MRYSPPVVLPRRFTLLVLLTLLTCCAPRGSRDGSGPARPHDTAPPAGIDASDAVLDAPAKPTAEDARARALRFAAPPGGSDKLVVTLTLVRD